MFKISVIETALAQTIVLEGSLTEPYIPEIKAAWKKALSENPKRRLIVDLRNTTFIDKKSEKVLVHMKHGGAQFIACGISTTHQLEDLGILCKGAMSNLH
jgi:anti-anti-sigma regulatory factor